MRVAVNLLSLLDPLTGIGRYTAELCRCLATADGLELLQVPSFRSVRFQSFVEELLPRDPGDPPGRPGASLWRRFWGIARHAGWRGLPRYALRRLGRNRLRHMVERSLTRQRCDLYHEPNLNVLDTDVPTVVNVHDISMVLHPEWHPGDRVFEYERDFRRGLAQACHILTGTEAVRREIIDILGWPPEQVAAVHNGVRPGLGPLPVAVTARALKPCGLKPGYLLFVGTLEPRKNLLTLVRAYCDLPASLRARAPLVLVGRWGWLANDLATYLADVGRHRGVIHLGYVAESRLRALYSGARALVFPSLYEGFGFPLVEMLACGGAVIASTAAAVTEVLAGSNAHLIDGLDQAGWRASLARIITDDDWRKELRRGAQQAAANFTWERCAAGTLNAYRTVLGRPVGCVAA
jgi:alpha-1,3-rhamnosyl/mannosyltransferase